jgi:hypothetical protein
MLERAVSLLLAQLNQYIRQIDGAGSTEPDVAVWGNIGQLESTNIASDLENHLVVTLVNVEEEATLKNGSRFDTDASGAVTYRNRPIHLNLFLLFSANYRNYETALRRVGHVLSFFQGKQRFTLRNSPVPGQEPAPAEDFSLTMDLLSLSLEEVNHLWGSLGGKQLPFVAYRARLVTVDDQRSLEGGGIVREIDVAGRDVGA